MNQTLLLLTILLIGCNAKEPIIESANLTGFDIPEYVDQRVWDFLIDKEGVTTLSIAYMSKFKTDKGVEGVEICYET